MEAKIWNLSGWVDSTDAAYIKSMLTDLLNLAKFTILKQTEERFVPFGYTCLWLLSESHLAVHTFPEQSTSYIELASCNEEKYIKFKSLMKNTFPQWQENQKSKQ